MNEAKHDDFDGLAVGWALNALEPDEERAFADHLATCPRCQRLVHESEQALGELAYDVPLIEPPPQLLARIRHATGASDAMPGRVGGPSTPQPTPIFGRRRVFRWAAPSMAAALVLVALLGWNVALRQRAHSQEQAAAQARAVITTLGKSTIRATLRDPARHPVGYVVQTGAQMEVVSAGTPARLDLNNTATTTYVLWALPGSGPPVAMGTFDIVRIGPDVRAVQGAVLPAGVTGFAVSREPGRGLPSRPTEVVASGSLQG